ncbi:MAG: hypothetical protein C0473_00465 [Cyanobacteria bacterium DS3.002]|nr:hypothetical protein [Cyanobacteria bacterium DS3.002]MBA4049964.1 hypothetical protein [Cyanobacteria bacterium DS2.008]MBA4076080.1 hypothetical protein [Cyanobacteria bacterium PR.023]
MLWSRKLDQKQQFSNKGAKTLMAAQPTIFSQEALCYKRHHKSRCQEFRINSGGEYRVFPSNKTNFFAPLLLFA